MSVKLRKILIIVENLPVPFDTRVWQEATTLVNNNYIVSVISPKGKGFDKDYEVLEGVHIYRHDLPSEGNGFMGYVNEYYCALKEEIRLAHKVYKEIGFDVIHGCNPPDNIYLVANRFRKHGVKYVFDHHDICPELYYAKFKKYGLLFQSQILLERMTYKNACMAFVTNDSYKKIAIERGGMREEDVFVLRSGPRLERLVTKEPQPFLKKGKKYMVGYVGVIGQQEGLDYLLEAARYIVKEKGRTDILFSICGSGPYLLTVQSKVHEMGLNGTFELLGRVPDNVLLNYLNTADVCVNPDEYNDMNDKSTMNKVLEYMALGKPIVQFDLTEGRVSAADAALYARPNDAQDMAEQILYLIDNPELRQKMGAIGRARIESQLSWEHTSKALLEGYDYCFKKYFEEKEQRGA